MCTHSIHICEQRIATLSRWAKRQKKMSQKTRRIFQKFKRFRTQGLQWHFSFLQQCSKHMFFSFYSHKHNRNHYFGFKKWSHILILFVCGQSFFFFLFLAAGCVLVSRTKTLITTRNEFWMLWLLLRWWTIRWYGVTCFGYLECVTDFASNRPHLITLRHRFLVFHHCLPKFRTCFGRNLVCLVIVGCFWKRIAFFKREIVWSKETTVLIGLLPFGFFSL